MQTMSRCRTNGVHDICSHNRALSFQHLHFAGFHHEGQILNRGKTAIQNTDQLLPGHVPDPHKESFATGLQEELPLGQPLPLEHLRDVVFS